ncbi:MAG: DUF1543 domain-containing protein [Bacteroidota bacterium]
MTEDSNRPKLFQLLLGAEVPNRNVEQHDYFFAIGHSLKELVPLVRAFWPETGNSLHLDGWREVNRVDGYKVEVVDSSSEIAPTELRLFFINLGGYTSGLLEEQHYTFLTVQPNKMDAVKASKKLAFFKSNSLKGWQPPTSTKNTGSMLTTFIK